MVGICLHASYEGEAPTCLEALCDESAHSLPMPLARDAMGVWRSDWATLVGAMLDERYDTAVRAGMFHASLAQTLCEQAVAVRNDSGVTRIGLSGGVFQNRVLTEQARALLVAEGFEVLIPQRLPVNDAGISYGQLIEAAAIHDAHV